MADSEPGPPANQNHRSVQTKCVRRAAWRCWTDAGRAALVRPSGCTGGILKLMATVQKTFHVSTKGNTDVLDLTGKVERIVAESRIRTGVVNVSGMGE